MNGNLAFAKRENITHAELQGQKKNILLQNYKDWKRNMCRTAKTNNITSAKLHGEQNSKCETLKGLESLLYEVTRTGSITQQVLKPLFLQILDRECI
jgi:hypothetical protein